MSPIQASLTVDLDALAANHALLRRLAGSSLVAPVVKANAYGLGFAAISRRLWAEGAREFFVARVSEGEALRTLLGPEATIYVLDGCPPGAARRLNAASLTPVLNSTEQVEDWIAEGDHSVALHVDTGLNRLGLRADEAQALAERLKRLGGLEIDVIMSHLSCGASLNHPMNHRQADAFRDIRALFPNARASLANSGGLFHGGGFLHDLVRPGITLYGGGPFERPDDRIAAVATFEAPIIQVREVPAGETVGYDAGYLAPEPLRVAIIAAGHADGVLRAQSPAGYGWLDGAKRRFLGRVSMDLIAIDVTEGPTPRPGDRVQLFGPEMLLDDVAVAGSTISYEILTRLSGRADVRYRGVAS